MREIAEKDKKKAKEKQHGVEGNFSSSSLCLRFNRSAAHNARRRKSRVVIFIVMSLLFACRRTREMKNFDFHQQKKRKIGKHLNLRTEISYRNYVGFCAARQTENGRLRRGFPYCWCLMKAQAKRFLYISIKEKLAKSFRKLIFCCLLELCRVFYLPQSEILKNRFSSFNNLSITDLTSFCLHRFDEAIPKLLVLADASWWL